VKRLYLQIYLTVVASLVAFATAAGMLWWIYVDQLAPRHPMEIISEAALALPPADAPIAQQQEGINRLALRLRGDAALYARDRTLIAQSGRPMPPPEAGRGPRAWTVPLADGRWLVARVSREYFRARRPGPVLMLILVALAVGVGAYPVVRRVTRRLDYKQDNRGYLNDVRTQVFVVDVATGERRRLTCEPDDLWYPQWSPDGRTIAARVSTDNGIYSQLALIDVATGRVKRVGPAHGAIGVWSWSPAGDRILFAGDTERTAQLDFFVYHVASDRIDRLTTDLQCLPELPEAALDPHSSNHAPTPR